MLMQPSKSLSPLEAERLQDPPQLPRCFAVPPSRPSAGPPHRGASPTRGASHPDSFSMSPALHPASPFVEIAAEFLHPRHAHGTCRAPPLRLASASVLPYSPFVVEEVHLDVEVLGERQSLGDKEGPAGGTRHAEDAESNRPARDAETSPFSGTKDGEDELRNGPLDEDEGAHKRKPPVREERPQREETETPRASSPPCEGERPRVEAAELARSFTPGDAQTAAADVPQVPRSALPSSLSSPETDTGSESRCSGAEKPSQGPRALAGPSQGRDSPRAAQSPSGAEPLSSRFVAAPEKQGKSHGQPRPRQETEKGAQVAAKLLDFDPQILHHFPMLANANTRIYQFVQRRYIRKIDGSTSASRVSLGESGGWSLPDTQPQPARGGTAQRRSGMARCIPNAISLPNLAHAATVLAAMGLEQLSGPPEPVRQSTADRGDSGNSGEEVGARTMWAQRGVPPSSPSHGDRHGLRRSTTGNRGGSSPHPGSKVRDTADENEVRLRSFPGGGNARADATSDTDATNKGLSPHALAESSSSSSRLSTSDAAARDAGVPVRSSGGRTGRGETSSSGRARGREDRACLSAVCGRDRLRHIDGAEREDHVPFPSAAGLRQGLEADEESQRNSPKDKAEAQADAVGATPFAMASERPSYGKEEPSPPSASASFFPQVPPARTEKKLLPPLRLGVVVGGLAPSSGVHNVIVGLSHFLRDFTRASAPDCVCQRGRRINDGPGDEAGASQSAHFAPSRSNTPFPQTPTIRQSISEPSNLGVRGTGEEGTRKATAREGMRDEAEAREADDARPAGVGSPPAPLHDAGRFPTYHATSCASTFASSGRFSAQGEEAKRVRDEATGRTPRGEGEPDGLSACSCSKLIGFLDGALGLAKDDFIELTQETVASYLNMGGCELLGYRAFKSLTDFSISRIQQVCEKHGLHGLVIVGGAEDLQAATQLAHRFLQEGLRTRVVAVPHSARGELHCEEFLPITLGFDSARSMLSEFCGNIALDSSSSKKYYHFVRCSSSNLTLECALQTRPTMCLTGLECDIEGWTLERIVEAICDVIVKRRKLLGKRSGTILLSEELVENLPEAGRADSASSAAPAWAVQPPTEASLCALLPARLARAFRLLPAYARRSLMLQHDCRGRPLLPAIEAEALLAQRVEKELRKRKTAGDARCVETFTYRLHYLGQEGRCPLPTRFDCSLGYALGTVAGAIVSFGLTGYMACVRNVHLPLDRWEACALPLVCLLKPSPRPPSPASCGPGASSVHPVRGEDRERGTDWKKRQANPADAEASGGSTPDAGNSSRQATAQRDEEGRAPEGDLHTSPQGHAQPREVYGHAFRSRAGDPAGLARGTHQPLAVPTIPPYRLAADSNLFRCYKRVKNSWKVYCLYRSPGPVSFAPTPRLTLTLCPACHRYMSFCICAPPCHSAFRPSPAPLSPALGDSSVHAAEAQWQSAARGSSSSASGRGEASGGAKRGLRAVDGADGDGGAETLRRKRQELKATEVHDGSIPLMLVAQFCSPLETLLRVQPLKLKRSEFTALFASPETGDASPVTDASRGLLQIAADPCLSRNRNSEVPTASCDLPRDAGGALPQAPAGEEERPETRTAGDSASELGKLSEGGQAGRWPHSGDREGEMMRKAGAAPSDEGTSDDALLGGEADWIEDAGSDSEAEDAEERVFPLEPPTLFLNCRRRCQLSYFQICRLDYKPKLPAVFFKPFTLACMDITAVISSNPVLLQRIFPLTHNLRAIDVVPMQQLLDADPWTPAPLPPSSSLLRFWRSPAPAVDGRSSPPALPPPCLPYHLKRGAKRESTRAQDARGREQSLDSREGGARGGGTPCADPSDAQALGAPASTARVLSGGAEAAEAGQGCGDTPAERARETKERQRGEGGERGDVEKEGEERRVREVMNYACPPGHPDDGKRVYRGETKPRGSEGRERPPTHSAAYEHPAISRPVSPSPGGMAEALRSAATTPSRRGGTYEGPGEGLRRGEGEKKLAPPPQFVGVHRGGLALRADANLGEALQFDAHETANSAAPFFAPSPLDPSPASPSYASLPHVSLMAEKPRRVSPYPAAFPSAAFVAPVAAAPPPLSETLAGLEGTPRKHAQAGELAPPEPAAVGPSGGWAPGSPAPHVGGSEGIATLFARPTAGTSDTQRTGGPPAMARIISPSLVAVSAAEAFGRPAQTAFDTPRSGRGRVEAAARGEGAEAIGQGVCADARGANRDTTARGDGRPQPGSWKVEGGPNRDSGTRHLRLHPLGIVRVASAPQREFPKVEDEDTFQPSHFVASHSTGHPPLGLRPGPHSGRNSREGSLVAPGVGARSPPDRSPVAPDGAQRPQSRASLGPSLLSSDRALGPRETHAPGGPAGADNVRSRSDPSQTASALASPEPSRRLLKPPDRGRGADTSPGAERRVGDSAGDRPTRRAVEGEGGTTALASVRVQSSAFVACLLRGDEDQREGRSSASSATASGVVRRNTLIDIRSSASPVVMLRYESGRAESLRLERGGSGRTRFSFDCCEARRAPTEERWRSLSPSHGEGPPAGDASAVPPLTRDEGAARASLSRAGLSTKGKRRVSPASLYFSSPSFSSSSLGASAQMRGGEEGKLEAANQEGLREGEGGSEREQAEMRDGRSEGEEGPPPSRGVKREPQLTAKANEGHIEPKLCLSRKSSRVNLVESQEPLRIAVCFFGRQAPGGLNAVMGVLEYLENLAPKGVCIGILGGILGLVHGWYTIVDKQSFSLFRNQGGLDLLCRTTEHFSNEFELQQCIKTIKALRLDGLVVLGGTSAVSDAAILTEYLLDADTQTCVVGVPMTVDNGMPFIEACLGHDTVCRVFNSIIGSLMRESRSSKCWYFIRVSGKCLSHLAAECALDTHPNLVLINEEIEQKRMGAMALTNLISDIVETRAGLGLHYGTVLLPDSLLAHLPEMHMLINEVDACFESGFYAQTEEGLELLRARLTPWSAALFSSLPKGIQWQLAFNKDQTYRVDLTAIDTEVLLKRLVERELARRKSIGAFRKGQFLCKTHFLAYQGRSAAPTNFDADLGFSYGYTAAVLVDGGCTGYMAQISNLVRDPSEWSVSAVPFTCLVDVQPVKPSVTHPCDKSSHVRQPPRHGYHVWSSRATNHAPHSSGHVPGRPVPSAASHTSEDSKRERDAPPRAASSSAGSAVVLMFRVEVPLQKLSLQGAMFRTLALSRAEWALGDCFSSPGPVQYEGAASRVRLNSLRLPSTDPTVKLKKISQLCSQVKSLCSVMATPPVLKTAESSLYSLVEVLSTLSRSERNQDLQFYDISHVLAQRFTTKAWLSAADSLPLSSLPSAFSSLPEPGLAEPQWGAGGPGNSCFLSPSYAGRGPKPWARGDFASSPLPAQFRLCETDERQTEAGREREPGNEARRTRDSDPEKNGDITGNRSGSLVAFQALTARPYRTGRGGRREWGDGESDTMPRGNEEAGQAFAQDATEAGGGDGIGTERSGPREEEIETLWSGEGHAATKRLPSFSLVCLNKASSNYAVQHFQERR
ncbi:hypothetical protein NCLIV_023360 [Neospora caninum Liverpool]|uniref:Phosphofructokinase domain-containing protein n=1 Tax=Neospora caninum (strain Liverpool) TaxID=572307 RepID=F0VFQ4_NEOCL|nr:hypothetical protein NCLIV_023360 [Neospora caninum Liverpool]CBZ52548.1 hypothetical protein NCLIV_023360 [Neospora caninum Liverpool]|eukprot:XP_003882580.1 hypothetical protein NCLIV_023360 [Neospora caninum Liverpool]